MDIYSNPSPALNPLQQVQLANLASVDATPRDFNTALTAALQQPNPPSPTGTTAVVNLETTDTVVLSSAVTAPGGVPDGLSNLLETTYRAPAVPNTGLPPREGGLPFAPERNVAVTGAIEATSSYSQERQQPQGEMGMVQANPEAQRAYQDQVEANAQAIRNTGALNLMA